MNAQYLGHVVFYVQGLERSLAFYRDLLGFQEVRRIFNGPAAALTPGRTHHELLCILVGNLSTSRSSGYSPFQEEQITRITFANQSCEEKTRCARRIYNNG